ncbi:cupin domain-containing protein [Sphingomonas sp.]|uniref:cupin domain-containing protein n=1 Tax=Sphingomonas sp. TaxID=28214 RepID=UPI00286D126E|nr:cupin domain-containing protein [Sphingomonas sp.]
MTKHRSWRISALTVGAAVALAGCQYQETADPLTNVAAPIDAAASASTANAAAPAAVLPVASEAPLVKAASDPALKWGPCPAPFPTGCELTMLHGNPAKPNADVLLRMPGGYIIPAHRHSSAERMILVSGQLEVKYQGAPAATLNAGNYAYGPASLPHRATCMGTAQCHLFVAFEGPVDVIAVEGSVD